MKKLINLDETLVNDIEEIEKMYSLGNMSSAIRMILTIGIRKIMEDKDEALND